MAPGILKSVAIAGGIGASLAVGECIVYIYWVQKYCDMSTGSFLRILVNAYLSQKQTEKVTTRAISGENRLIKVNVYILLL